MINTILCRDIDSDCSLAETCMEPHWNYIPLASTVISIIHLYHKCIWQGINSQTLREGKKNYYDFLAETSLTRCTLLFIPILGNIIIGIYDAYRSQVLDAVTTDHIPLSDINSLFQDDLEIVMAACRYDLTNAEFASTRIKNSPEFIRFIAGYNFVFALTVAGEELQTDTSFVLEMAQRGPHEVLQDPTYGNQRINNVDIMRELIITQGRRHLILFMGENLRNDTSFILEIAQISPHEIQLNLQDQPQGINNIALMHELIVTHKRRDLIYLLSKNLQNDVAFMAPIT